MKSRALFFVASAGAICAVTVMLLLRSPLPSEQPTEINSRARAVQASERASDAPSAVTTASPSAGKEGDRSQATLVFSGIIKLPDGTRFILTDLRTRKSSTWLALEETFLGHRLTSFNAATEVLTVERDGQALELPLKLAHVKSGTAPPAPANKIEFRIAIAPDGKLSTHGRAIPFETFNLMLQDYGRNGSTLVVVVQQPPNPDAKIQEINKSISDAVGTSGARKSSVRIVPFRTAK
jgi:hypothetical protein